MVAQQGGAEGFGGGGMPPLDLGGEPPIAQASFKEHGYHAASLFGIPRVQRGHIVQASRMRGQTDNTTGNPEGTSSKIFRRRALRFLFNPQELSLTWTIREDLFAGGLVPGDTGPAFGTEAAAFNLNLLFDRTQEIAEADPRFFSTHVEGQPLVSDIGVQEDVWQFQKMLGIMTEGPVQTQPLRMVPLLFFPNADFGDTAATSTDSAGNFSTNGAWKPMVGYINSAQVTYTQFSYKMVPMRCIIAISFLRYYVAPGIGQTSIGDLGNSLTAPPPGSGSSPGGSAGNTAPSNANDLPQGV